MNCSWPQLDSTCKTESMFVRHRVRLSTQTLPCVEAEVRSVLWDKESTIGLIGLIELPKELEAPIGLNLKIKGNGSIVLF